jgi:hypothetical protein
MTLTALAFFNEYSGLRDLSPETRTWRGGRCTSCGGRTEVTKLGKNAVCQMCVPLRQTYPQAGGKKPMALSKGSFAQITRDRSIFWTYLPLDQSFPRIERRVAKENQLDILIANILKPPPPPYLFIVFAPSNNASDFVLNTSHDHILVSNSALVTVGRYPISGVNRRKVADLIAGNPEVTGKVWNTLIRARASLLDYSVSKADSAKLTKLLDQYADLLDKLPPLNSPEHIMLMQFS